MTFIRISILAYPDETKQIPEIAAGAPPATLPALILPPAAVFFLIMYLNGGGL